MITATCISYHRSSIKIKKLHTGKKPDSKYMRVFGFKCFIRVPNKRKNETQVESHRVRPLGNSNMNTYHMKSKRELRHAVGT